MVLFVIGGMDLLIRLLLVSPCPRPESGADHKLLLRNGGTDKTYAVLLLSLFSVAFALGTSSLFFHEAEVKNDNSPLIFLSITLI